MPHDVRTRERAPALPRRRPQEAASPSRPARSPKPSSLARWLTMVLAALCVVGLVMVGSASSVISIVYYGSTWAIVFRECLWLVVGVAVFFVAAGLSTKRLRKVATLGIVASVGLLVVVMVPGLATSSFGASRWVGFGLIRIQPSEVAKLALCLYVAHVITKKERVEHEWGRVLRPVAIVTCLCAGLVLIQPDMGTAVVLVAIALAVVTIAGAPWRAITCTMGALALAAVVAGIALPYRRARLLSFLNPLANRSGNGYQEWESKIGLGSGHLFGLGLGNSREKWGLLPNPHTDFIFSIIGEELGLVGSLLVLALLVTLIMLGLRVASRAPDRFSQLVAVGIATWLATETIVNVGAVIGILPITGIPLPFISFGGTSLVIDMAAVGVLVGIAKRGAERDALASIATPSRPRAASPHRRPAPGRARPHAPRGAGHRR